MRFCRLKKKRRLSPFEGTRFYRYGDCLYALQPTIPRLTLAPLFIALFDDTARLPDVEGNKPSRKKFKQYPIGYFHIDIAELKNCRR